MRLPDCLLVRVGEQALKSDYVQKRFLRILLNNIRSGLKGIKYEVKTDRNRILIHTKQTKKTINILKRIFGITSISPVWVCKSELKDISSLSARIAKEVLKLNKNRSFAIRARRVGFHDFTSQNIGERTGNAVGIKTSAKVDLSNPDKEIFVECRDRETYVYTDRTPGPGGLPLGTAGKILSILYDLESAVAAWLMMKRGAELIVLTNKKSKFLNILKKWYIGKKLKILIRDFKHLKEIIEKEQIQSVILGESVRKEILKEIRRQNLLILRPLVGFNKKHLNSLYKEFTRYKE